VVSSWTRSGIIWLAVGESSSGRHPGTSMAPRIAASTKPRLRGVDSMNPSFGSFGSSTGMAGHRCAGGSLGALRPRLSAGLPLSRPSRGGVRSCRSVVREQQAAEVALRYSYEYRFERLRPWVIRHTRVLPTDFPPAAEHRSRAAGPRPQTRSRNFSPETWHGWPWPPRTGHRLSES
jgi:hypothetical protein